MVKIIKKRWYIFVTLILIVVFIIYQRSTSRTASGNEKNTYTVKKQTIKDELSLSGEIDAEEHVTLRFQSSGRLSWVGVKEGNYIKRYQTIATLDQRDVKKNLEKSLRDYAKERWDFEEDKEVTYKSSVKTDTVRRILEKNQFDLEKTVLDVELKQLSVELSSLISPIEGIVTRVASPYAGVNSTPTQAEFEIVNPNTIFFSATADQTDVVKLRQGLNGEIVLDSYPDKTLKSNIDMISFVPKEGETGTVYKVKIVLNEKNNDYKFRLGMTGDVNFVLKQRKNAIAIPTSYIKTEKNKKYVWKLEDGKKIKTFITVAGEINGSSEIKSGLREGDTVTK